MGTIRGEGGYTLVEALTVVGLLALVVGLLVVPLTLSQRVERRDVNYDLVQQQAESGLESMVAQIRQATAILASGPNSVEMNVTLNGTPQLVAYECDIPQSGTPYRECMRVSATQGGSLPPFSQGAIVLQNLLNGTATQPVFTWAPDPNAPYYMTATAVVPASNGQSTSAYRHAIVLSDGALMRNLNVGE